jgi:hypothetical protein
MNVIIVKTVRYMTISIFKPPQPSLCFFPYLRFFA